MGEIEQDSPAFHSGNTHTHTHTHTQYTYIKNIPLFSIAASPEKMCVCVHAGNTPSVCMRGQLCVYYYAMPEKMRDHL